MAASLVLVDSSFYIGCLRAGRDPLRALAATAMSADLAVCGIVRCEVGRGLRHPTLRSRFHAVWDVMVNVPADQRFWFAVEETLWNLDRKGVVLPLTDVAIGCAAQQVGACVLTLDKHFCEIPGVRVIEQPPL